MKLLPRLLLLFALAPHALRAGETESRLEIFPEEEFQTVQGFGASDAWMADVVGTHWSPEAREGVAELLFSRRYDAKGNPRGAGLSIWRFNIGAGSREQGGASQISSSDRRAECFLLADGSYDWTKQAGQQWFLQKAASYGVEERVAFSNSPPVFFTRNGIAHGSGGLASNLKDAHYEDYAEFLTRVLKQFDSKGLPFAHVSPVNEPQYAWETRKQEGSPWTNAQIAKVTRSLDKKLRDSGLDTSIMIPECADYQNLVGVKGSESHSRQIEAFFDPKSPHYLGDLERVPPVIAAHAYWTTYTNGMIRDYRKKISDLCRKYEIGFRQSEYSLIGLSSVRDDKPESEMEIALFIAKIIHADMTLADSVAWSFWTAMSGSGRTKNRYHLVELVPRNPRDHEQGGTFKSTKSLWILANYSRFIRPGFKRVGLRPEPELSRLMGSAYKSPDGKILVCVFVNMEDSTHVLSTKSLPAARRFGQFETSASRNFQLVSGGAVPSVIRLVPNSVNTLVFLLK